MEIEELKRKKEKQRVKTLLTQELAEKSNHYKEAILKDEATDAEYEAFIIYNREVLRRIWEVDVEFYAPYE